MIEKLKEIISRYSSIETQMSDPSLVNNLDDFKKVTREHNRLKPIGLPFIPKKLSKNEYYTALKGFAMVSDGETLTKEVSIH